MNTSEITNNLIDKIVAMYIPDGNPENWLKKIIALKESISEYEIGEKLEFIIVGRLHGNYLSMYDENVIVINVTLDDSGMFEIGEEAMVNKCYLIK